MEELISIIIPVYNVEKYLDRCMQSVLNQTYKNLEIILVDDGSTDTSGKICEEYRKIDKRVFVLHKENGGLSSARNAGLEIKKGEYVLFVDSDDWIEPDMLEQLYGLLLENPGAQIAECARSIAYSSNDSIQQPELKVVVKTQKELLDDFYRVRKWGYSTAVWKKLIRASVLDKFQFVITLNEDIEACFEFIMRTDSWVQTNQILYHYFRNDNGITRRRFSIFDLEYLSVWDRVVERTKKECPKYTPYAEKLRIRADYTLLCKMFLRGYNHDDRQMVETKKKLKRSLRRNFWRIMKWKMPLSRRILLFVIVI